MRFASSLMTQGAIDSIVRSRMFCQRRSRYSRSRLISVLERERPAVRTMTAIRAGISRSFMIFLRRRLSSALTILREIPPPRIALGMSTM